MRAVGRPNSGERRLKCAFRTCGWIISGFAAAVVVYGVFSDWPWHPRGLSQIVLLCVLKSVSVTVLTALFLLGMMLPNATDPDDNCIVASTFTKKKAM